MKLSIVATFYKAESYIEEFIQRINAVAAQCTPSFEVILVNDGSPDRSMDIVTQLSTTIPHLQIVDLSRNFGHHRAMMAGLSHATGERVFLIDSDLEEPPELLHQFWQAMDCNRHVDVFYGYQAKRDGPWFHQLPGRFYYYLFNKMSDTVKITPNVCTVRIMSEGYVQELIRFTDRDFYFPPICSMVGFHQRGICVQRSYKGWTTYSLLKRYHVFINSILAFSSLPLYGVFYLGLGMSFISMMMSAYVMIQYAIGKISVTGWTSMMISIWFLSGVIISCLGLAAIYIAKIHQEVRHRPLFTVRGIVRHGFNVRSLNQKKLQPVA